MKTCMGLLLFLAACDGDGGKATTDAAPSRELPDGRAAIAVAQLPDASADAASPKPDGAVQLDGAIVSVDAAPDSGGTAPDVGREAPMAPDVRRSDDGTVLAGDDAQRFPDAGPGILTVCSQGAYGPLKLGETDMQRECIKNTGTAMVDGLTLEITVGIGVSSWRILIDCAGILPPGSSCMPLIEWKPTAAYQTMGTLVAKGRRGEVARIPLMGVIK